MKMVILRLRVTKRSDETVLVKNSRPGKKRHRNNKSKTEAFIDKFSNYYTPAVYINSS